MAPSKHHKREAVPSASSIVQTLHPRLLSLSGAKAHRLTVYSPPHSILVLAHDTPSGTLTVSVCESIVAMPIIIAKSSSAIRSLFSHCKVSRSRLIYITAGLMFTPASPMPFGGPKTRPGYTEYIGTTVVSLLLYLVESSFKRYWTCRGREALDFLVGCANKARNLHFAGDADVLNELMLKGIKKAGHIAWNKPVRIPEALRHRQEVQSDAVGSEVLFTPRLSRLRHAFNQ
ncbi:hypothetical protein BJ741DRAFT_581430 [Chytriomyces cf. hyalinus JEL632]|nr:hypothetical protein BJ741DRAFT_581430 [Chytriomyces cf. hyalinus JEL632]